MLAVTPCNVIDTIVKESDHSMAIYVTGRVWIRSTVNIIGSVCTKTFDWTLFILRHSLTSFLVVSSAVNFVDSVWSCDTWYIHVCVFACLCVCACALVLCCAAMEKQIIHSVRAKGWKAVTVLFPEGSCICWRVNECQKAGLCCLVNTID